MSSYNGLVWCICDLPLRAGPLVHACEERYQESRMRENRMSGSMRGGRMPLPAS